MPLHKALLALWLAAGSGAKRAENVVMLLADDLGWADVSVPPHKKAALWVTETPHLERMAREGLTLTGYRNAASVCSPSRLAIATGVFPWRYRLSGLLKDGFRGLPRAPTTARELVSTTARVLLQAREPALAPAPPLRPPAAPRVSPSPRVSVSRPFA